AFAGAGELAAELEAADRARRSVRAVARGAVRGAAATGGAGLRLDLAAAVGLTGGGVEGLTRIDGLRDRVTRSIGARDCRRRRRGRDGAAALCRRHHLAGVAGLAQRR